METVGSLERPSEPETGGSPEPVQRKTKITPELQAESQ